MGLWHHQLHLRLACYMDDRHLRQEIIAIVHIPQHVLDVTGRWYELLYSQK